MEHSDQIKPFGKMIASENLKLERKKTTVLQVNVGYLCNQKCRHCHLEAGPARKEVMSLETMNKVIDYARQCNFMVIDVTGGAPEMVPYIDYLIDSLTPLAQRFMFRSNLSALGQKSREDLIYLLKEHQAVIIASMPSINEAQTDGQRGSGIFSKSISTLKKLNELGYGCEAAGLELNLVSNPSGAFLPQPQEQTEKRFRKVLKEKWGIVFNHLFSFANVPLGRFKKWLIESNNYSSYMNKLASSFNPCSIEGLMCRNTISVSWDGFLYDCDFNLAADLPMTGKKINVSSMRGLPKEGIPISVSDYCYTCTAGTGFT